MVARISEMFLYKESGKCFFIKTPNPTKNLAVGREGVGVRLG